MALHFFLMVLTAITTTTAFSNSRESKSPQPANCSIQTVQASSSESVILEMFTSQKNCLAAANTTVKARYKKEGMIIERGGKGPRE